MSSMIHPPDATQLQGRPLLPTLSSAPVAMPAAPPASLASLVRDHVGTVAMMPAAQPNPPNADSNPSRRDVESSRDDGTNFRMVSVQNGPINQVVCSTCSKIKPPSEFSGRAKSTCNQCGEKKKMAYVARRDKKHIETSEIKNENHQLRLQMEEQGDEIEHLKSVLTLMSKPQSLDADFYSQCQLLHERPADYTVSFQMLAAQSTTPHINSSPKPQQSHSGTQKLSAPDTLRGEQPIGATIDPKRRKLDSMLLDSMQLDSMLPSSEPIEKWRQSDSAFGIARAAVLAAENARNENQRLASAEEETRLRYQAALAAENARTENQRLSRQEEETRLRYQAALAAEKVRENQRSSSRVTTQGQKEEKRPKSPSDHANAPLFSLLCAASEIG